MVGYRDHRKIPGQDTQDHDHDTSAKATGRCRGFQEFRVQGRRILWLRLRVYGFQALAL